MSLSFNNIETIQMKLINFINKGNCEVISTNLSKLRNIIFINEDTIFELNNDLYYVQKKHFKNIKKFIKNVNHNAVYFIGKCETLESGTIILHYTYTIDNKFVQRYKLTSMINE